MTREMLSPVKANWGLGPVLYTRGAARFGHDGLNEGFQSFMMAYVGRGEGIVVLTNGGQGRRLVDEVVRAVATDYRWTDIAMPTTQEKVLSPIELARFAGRFEGGGLSVVFEARPDALFANIGGPRLEQLTALSQTRFRFEAMSLVTKFSSDYSSLDIVEGGPLIKLVRSKVTPEVPHADGS